jgi:signal transduction histidine kinase
MMRIVAGGVRGWWAWVVVAVVVAADAVSLRLRWLVHEDPAVSSQAGIGSIGRAMAAFAVAAVVGAVVERHQPRQVVGRLLLAMALAFAVLVLVESTARWALLARDGEPVGARAAGWASLWLWVPVFALVGLLLLVFPDGRPPPGRWRHWRTVLVAASGILVVGFALAPEELDEPFTGVANPLHVGGPAGGVLHVAQGAGYLALIVAMAASALSLVARWRGPDRVQRQQVSWVALAAAVLGGALVANAFTADAGGAVDGVVTTVADVALAGVFVAIGVAVLQHRLYDVDVVVNRAVVSGCLAVFVTAVYGVVVLGAGSLVDGRDDERWFSVLATAVAAVAFAPVRARAQLLANRLVYGELAAPYDVLADLGHRLAAAVSTDDVLPSMARAAATGVGAAVAEVRVRLPDGSRRSARWPDDAEPPGDDAEVFPVVHADGPFGEIVVGPRPGVPLDRRQRALLGDLAGQAVLALGNLRLTAELEDQLARVSRQAHELRASRQRLVVAQDDERRRLERDIHDGVQQQLVAVTLQLRAAAARASDETVVALEQIRALVTDSLATLRDLARGVFPPMLAERGIAPALEAGIAKAHVVATVDDRIPHGIRGDADVEAAVYFCCLEALQNVAKHAGDGARATITLTLDGDILEFRVVDDGCGFEGTSAVEGTGVVGMADRVGAIGGALEVTSRPGVGTTVVGRVPFIASDDDGGAGTTVHR